MTMYQCDSGTGTTGSQDADRKRSDNDHQDKCHSFPKSSNLLRFESLQFEILVFSKLFLKNLLDGGSFETQSE